MDPCTSVTNLDSVYESMKPVAKMMPYLVADSSGQSH